MNTIHSEIELQNNWRNTKFTCKGTALAASSLLVSRLGVEHPAGSAGEGGPNAAGEPRARGGRLNRAHGLAGTLQVTHEELSSEIAAGFHLWVKVVLLNLNIFAFVYQIKM